VNFLVKQHIEPGENILTQSVLHFNVFLIPPCFHCTDSHQPLSACFIILWIGQINSRIFGAALTTQCSRLSNALIPVSSSTSDSLSGSQSSLFSFGYSQSPFQLCQFSVLDMLSGAPSSSLLVGCRSILLIRQILITIVYPPGRLFADKAGGKGDLSDNLNAAAPSVWTVHQEMFMILSVSEMNPMAVICLL